jgi:hypothetical protein
MKPPIFVFEPNDLTIFESVENAERYIEPPEVRDGSLFFYDSEGRVLEGSVYKDSRGIELCRISEGKECKFVPDTLREVISSSLELLGYSREDLDRMDLSRLADESLKFKTT